ncbi:3-dehydroquinate synthase [Thermoplasma sp.]|uniref:3-dehydroquinate synthase n=1 Tax=Thermoplasma sp. TaxID=1973142 RepID=UPI00126F630F|nr:3-dehydroquinate synthase [Thermoplasma sp.]KAA8922744.1 MAG: 3-dehydroquinate synthase [Thermoplasma sp.]
MDAQRFVLPMNGENISVVVGEDVTGHINEEVGHYDSLVFMISRTVEEMFGSKIPPLENYGSSTIKMTLNDGESLKTLRNYQRIIKVLVEKKVSRNSLLVYVGGGTVGDLAGFVAATYKRGIRMIAVPTTLLAQVDSSIGGKNGIDFSDVKNVIGTFYNPYLIIDDLQFLKSTPELIKEGMGEVIKYSIIAGGDMFRKVSECSLSSFHDHAPDIVKMSIRIKADIVNRDYYDRNGIRSTLNLGHTIAHGIEGASKGQISHGRAVATGLMVEAHIGEKYGNTKPEVIDAIMRLVDNYEIERVRISDIGVNSILRYVSNDKKMAEGYINMPVPAEIGNIITMKVTDRMISDGLNTFIREHERR